MFGLWEWTPSGRSLKFYCMNVSNWCKYLGRAHKGPNIESQREPYRTASWMFSSQKPPPGPHGSAFEHPHLKSKAMVGQVSNQLSTSWSGLVCGLWEILRKGDKKLQDRGWIFDGRSYTLLCFCKWLERLFLWGFKQAPAVLRLVVQVSKENSDLVELLLRALLCHCPLLGRRWSQRG